MKKSTYSTYSVSNGTPWFKWLGAAFVFGAFIALMWFATSNKDALMQDDEDLELILPLAGPVKVRANEPGGMKVADRDRQVFDLLDSTSADALSNETLCDSAEGKIVCNGKLPQVAHLAANPEAVKKAAEEAEEAKLKPKSADIALLIKGYEPVVVTPVIKEPISSKQPVAVELKANEKRIEANKAGTEANEKGIVVEVKTPKENIKQKTAKTSSDVVGIEVIAKEKLYTGGAWGVQLASYKTLENADTGSKIFLKKFPDILKTLTYVTEKVDIKDKGRFYRVQFIGLKDKDSAKKACDNLKGKGQGCWYVSR